MTLTNVSVLNGMPFVRAYAVRMRSELAGLSYKWLQWDKGWAAGPGFELLPEVPDSDARAEPRWLLPLLRL